MNISRGEVNEFNFSSSLGIAAESILTFGSADTKTKTIRVTDIKMSCGGTARTVKFFVSNYSSYGKALEYDLPASSVTDLSFNIPYKLQVVSSTVEERNFVASASGTGVKYSIGGYTE